MGRTEMPKLCSEWEAQSRSVEVSTKVVDHLAMRDVLVRTGAAGVPTVANGTSTRGVNSVERCQRIAGDVK